MIQSTYRVRHVATATAIAACLSLGASASVASAVTRAVGFENAPAVGFENAPIKVDRVARTERVAHIARQAHKKADRHTHKKAETQAERHAHKKADRHTHKKAETQAERHAHKKADRHTHKKADRHTKTQAERHTHTKAKGHAHKRTRGHAHKKADGHSHKKAKRHTQTPAQRNAHKHANPAAKKLIVGTAAKASATPVKSSTPIASPAAASPAAPAPATAPPVTPSVAVEPAGIAGNWNLVMDSEFNTSALNTNIWTPGWFGTGVTDPVNGAEDDCYNSSNVYMAGGTLNLNVTHTSSACNGKSYPYTGSLVSTNPNGHNAGFLYTYGVVESRVYVPAAANGQIANWPAVWAVTPPSETYGEDDAFEGLVGQACFHYHNSDEAPGSCDTTLTPGWHTFASDWQPGLITYYYDGTEVGSEASISNEPMYIILDNTVSANNLNIAGASTMQVQYVRVWQN